MATGFDKQSLILKGVNVVCETDERRKTFEVMADDIAARFRGLFPNTGLYAYDKQENAISAIYNRLQESKEIPDVIEMLQALYRGRRYSCDYRNTDRQGTPCTL